MKFTRIEINLSLPFQIPGMGEDLYLVAVSRGYSVVAECELLIEVTSLVAEHQL